MIKKERKRPIILKKLEALDRRVPIHHTKKQIVTRELAKVEAGFRGEQALNYHLTFLPKKNYFILHDLRLRDKEKGFFQIDTVILTPKFHLVLEVKNIAGTLFFDQEFHQLIRTLPNESHTFPDPLLQIRRQKQQFQSWLAQNKFSDVPVISYVIISSPSSTIQTIPRHSHLLRNVIHSATLPLKVEELEKRYEHILYTTQEMNALSRKLIKMHIPYNPDILSLFQVCREDIIKGVYCENCLSYLIERVWGSWRCLNCKLISNKAHISALEDYFLLFGPNITNAELRSFLKIESESIAREILTAICDESLGVIRIGVISCLLVLSKYG
ncbi:nuclease-related domain-containing protein [Cytobacillus massiliigabonensis]|uniref:nuclease-related domain-containing protein n=1 Tax=Cytobacillus massiliigabonensis TaxID=1871011 RepID=UPI0015E0DB62|nr:nuclease-related domain-containing protein [Cytobacillus massiliigabonensis]